MASDELVTIPRGGAATHWNADLIEDLHARWKENPAAVSESWQMFFEGFELAMCPRKCVAADQARAQSEVNRMIFAYRSLGHMEARIDPLGHVPPSHPDLDPKGFGFSDEDATRVFDTGSLVGPARAPLKDILAHLRDTYTRSIGVEYMHIQEPTVRRWLQERMEPIRNRPPFPKEKRLETLRLLIDAEVFETFLHTYYPGQKRFSLEGAEALIPSMHAIVEWAPELGVQEIVLGMSHRGRLNALANILDKSYGMIFSEFEDSPVDQVWGSGDVKYHRGYASDHVNALGQTVHLSLTSNPSHLEAVDPVVEGRARAKQRQHDDMEERRKVVPLIVHGDASFAGQGIVAETLNLSQLDGYRTGGTIHLIVNNQIGFTATPEEARSSHYATDVAKMIEAPIFHVNADDPEAVVYISELALRFRQEFHRDVVLDLVCYRRHGHNEGDDPAFTNPTMVKAIKARPSIRRLYMQQLLRDGLITPDDESRLTSEIKARLKAELDRVKSGETDKEPHAFEGLWAAYNRPYSIATVKTGVSLDDLEKMTRGLATVPPGFKINPKVARRLEAMQTAVLGGGNIDWSFAESLAFGSLLVEGTPIRLSGQDSARGTFSQRHSVWMDADSGQAYKPLNHLSPGQSKFCVYNSLLSEAAVLGFDYGYSLAEPRMLILWEAQFGDFANGAQVIIDQFIVGSESKWQRTSGLVMLLPHGFEGQGPEHSNAYLERYLQACAENNIQVTYPSTPAQYFHLLRRQIKQPFRRPLIVMTPKSLLRHKSAVSPIGELATGHFHEILDDPAAPEKPERLIFCSGKVYYDLIQEREKMDKPSSAIVRVEQFYPFADHLMPDFAERYASAREVLWVQEEPQNRGGWTFIKPRIEEHFKKIPVRYVGRPASASPAVGSHSTHRETQADIVREALTRIAPSAAQTRS